MTWGILTLRWVWGGCDLVALLMGAPGSSCWGCLSHPCAGCATQCQLCRNCSPSWQPNCCISIPRAAAVPSPALQHCGSASPHPRVTVVPLIWQWPWGKGCQQCCPGSWRGFSRLCLCVQGANVLFGLAPMARSSAWLIPVCIPWAACGSCSRPGRQKDRAVEGRAAARGEGSCWHLPLSRKMLCCSEQAVATSRAPQCDHST